MSRSRSKRFETTQWSVVLAAGVESSARRGEALAQLFEAYWYPLYTFIRRQGYDAEDGHDLTQSYFASLLERQALARVRPESGRFRSFLLASLRHFLANERAKRMARKRGAKSVVLPLDAAAADSSYRELAIDERTPEQVFERQWARTLLDRALERLRREAAGEDSAERFESLRPYLTGDEAGAAYDVMAEELRMSRGAVKVAVHRLRKRFGVALRQELAATVADPEQIDDELRHLLSLVND